MPIYAHSANDEAQRHLLADHLCTVAQRTASYMQDWGLSDLGYRLGWWHDVGKIHPGFQRYLLRSEAGQPARSQDHKLAGALAALQAGLDLAVLVVQGHHGGLTNPSQLKAWIGDPTRSAAAREALAQAAEIWPQQINGAAELPQWALRNPLDAEMLGRVLLSALVDADWSDTAAHFRDLPDRPSSPALAQLWQRFEADQQRLAANSAGPVNALRDEIYAHCLRAADAAPGLYRMAVPTGGGKTRSAMAFALRHALAHGMRRIIVAVPYITITEQTAQVYRQIFGPGSVLEHHSAVDLDQEDLWMRAAAEDWDAPVIVTTTVQLFESLFARQPRRLRKLHRLARSVIILDEAQTLPVHLLEPALDALRFLTARAGASVILSTATQPAFDVVGPFAQLPARQIVPHPERYYEALERVRYDWRTETPMSWPDVAQEMSQHRQALAVVNTKADAAALVRALDPLVDSPPLHLSTNLCAAHRRVVLSEVRERLAHGAPCHLVSTQVVEAGVDIDFPLVMRAMAPLDSIIQAAGRCNREGRLDHGQVIVFRPQEGRLPQGNYEIATQIARAILDQYGAGVGTPEITRRYFEALYDTVPLDDGKVQQKRRRLDYVATAEAFRIIDDCQTSVIVPYQHPAASNEVNRLLDALAEYRADPQTVMRKLQPYLVQIPTYRLSSLEREGFLAEQPRLPGFYLWGGEYDQRLGLVFDRPAAATIL
jgi:CRISPR-associated endonuclease/helicase Cas3